jgi:Haloacid Dehalogenase superfamily, subfamily IB, phosphoserine phosphatase-like
MTLNMGKNFDLVAFDMDGVLFNHKSSWAWIHDQYGVDNVKSFNAFIKGEIDEKEFMRRDIALWKNIDPEVSIQKLTKLFRNMPLYDGIQETVASLQWNGLKCVIVSGGVDIAANMICNEFGFDGAAANSLEADENGILTGEGIVNVDLTDKGVKLREYIKEFNTTRERTISIGNSYTDINMFKASGFSIAFNPIDEPTKLASDKILVAKNISDILDIIFDLEEQ